MKQDIKLTNVRIYQLADEIVNIGKKQLLLNLRFLNRAVFALVPIVNEAVLLTTNGHDLFYDPKYLLKQYRDNQTVSLRFWLHPLMHCLFLHMFVDLHIDQHMWDLACDIACEAMIDDLNLRELQDPIQKYRHQELLKFHQIITPLTAEKIYHYLMNEKIENSLISAWESLFQFDEHEIWYAGQDSKFGIANQKKRQVNSNDFEHSDEIGQGKNSMEDQKSLWKNISKHIESDLYAFSKEYGEKSGELVKALEIIHREKCDYRQFLKKFAHRSEVVKVSPDEFDYIFYTYGLELYKDIPLIEPLEYREDKRIRDFVIVLDTSGSVQGNTIQLFLQKTLTILKQEEAFDQQFHLHIIQCDAKIKKDDIIKNQREFDSYIENLSLHGFGGTDFRPAIEYIEKLKKDGYFHHLKGILYFTDGLGIYPEKMPSFLTTFVFVDNDNAYYAPVPKWAIRILLSKDELEIL